MRKKQANMHLDQRHQLMLENAFYMVSDISLFTWPRRWPAKKKETLLLTQKICSATHLKELSEK